MLQRDPNLPSPEDLAVMTGATGATSWPWPHRLLGARTQKHAQIPLQDELAAFRPRLGKRLLDCLLSAVIMVATAPVFGMIALLIFVDSQGAIIYTQERVGMNRRRRLRASESGMPVTDRRRQVGEGRPFAIYKFRTMVTHAEDGLGPTWAVENDPRVTPVGRFLRASRLDELPQLWNVIRGDMSLVGPRPERPHFVNHFARRIPRYRQRLYAPPGITGRAQVEHRYDASEDDVRQKLEYDLEYIRRASLEEDLRILVKTVNVMLLRRGAR
jgi:lipopolysaccharide/colanic/teichoic acid biosynthesis glycosyltransferase